MSAAIDKFIAIFTGSANFQVIDMRRQAFERTEIQKAIDIEYQTSPYLHQVDCICPDCIQGGGND